MYCFCNCACYTLESGPINCLLKHKEVYSVQVVPAIYVPKTEKIICWNCTAHQYQLGFRLFVKLMLGEKIVLVDLV